MNILRRMIRIILEKKLEDDKTLLTEPDEVEGDEEEAEASFGGVAGVSVPLGAGPNQTKQEEHLGQNHRLILLLHHLEMQKLSNKKNKF